MKKASFALLGLAALVVSACNSKSEPSYSTIGSFESIPVAGSSLVGPDGRVYIRGEGSTVAMPTAGDLSKLGLNRSRIYFEYQGVEGTSPLTDQTVQMKLHFYELIPTYVPAETGTASYDDALLLMTAFSSPTSESSGAVISANGNYLDMGFLTVGYAANKTTNEQYYASQKFSFEVDPTVISGVERDTVVLRMKFEDNRNEATEKVLDGVTTVIYQVAVDLQSLADELAAGPSSSLTLPVVPKDKYIVKLYYKTYNSTTNPSTDAVDEAYVTTRWNPAEPYGIQ